MERWFFHVREVNKKSRNETAEKIAKGGGSSMSLRLRTTLLWDIFLRKGAIFLRKVRSSVENIFSQIISLHRVLIRGREGESFNFASTINIRRYNFLNIGKLRWKYSKKLFTRYSQQVIQISILIHIYFYYFLNNILNIFKIARETIDILIYL